MHIRIDVYRLTQYNSLVYYARRVRDGHFYGYMEDELFSTNEEAKIKLKEIQSE